MTRLWIVVFAVPASPALPVAPAQEKVLTVSKDGLSVEGKIETNDPKIKVHEPKFDITIELAAKVYQVKLTGGTKYRFDLVSTDFDAVLAIQDADGQQLAFDDDSGGGLNARLDFVPAKDGTYKVVVASLDPPGAYRLTIKDAGQAAAAKQSKDVPKSSAPAGEIVIKITDADIDKQQGLVPGTKTLEWVVRQHAVKLEGKKTYRIDATPQDAGFDPILVIHDGAGKQIGFDDDGGGYPNARFLLKTTKDDTYKIHVGTIGKTGRYALTITDTANENKVISFQGEIGAAPVPKPVAPKAPIKNVDAGAVPAAGAKYHDKLAADVKAVVYRVKLEAGKSYVIDMTSADTKALDPLLRIVDEKGKLLAENDDVGGNLDLNSRIVFRPPVAGTYLIFATSFGNVGVGEFTLEIKLKE
ncbi:MAG: PPC domain-containing protein [Gemmataceae bacterium]|nr:PPC domain-containing protein [Gemmataceae bacterium]